ncbi:acylphosphatase [Caproicibacterium amylolyticum]|uniref:acylphosphatase n=2 Tax=Caproicibacterium amylolyticum TaxID=2766537 RepID=A0A7G9WJ11_9FIRM|nr:acylphosphatase [Caproicibacterium amylolyticum]
MPAASFLKDVYKIMRYRVKVTGMVQGVGFRYYVSQSAANLGLTGWVKNQWDASVSLEVQGSACKLEQFLKEVQYGNAFAQVDALDCKKIAEQPGESRFEIIR